MAIRSEVTEQNMWRWAARVSEVIKRRFRGGGGQPIILHVLRRMGMVIITIHPSPVPVQPQTYLSPTKQ